MSVRECCAVRGPTSCRYAATANIYVPPRQSAKAGMAPDLSVRVRLCVGHCREYLGLDAMERRRFVAGHSVDVSLAAHRR